MYMLEIETSKYFSPEVKKAFQPTKTSCPSKRVHRKFLFESFYQVYSRKIIIDLIHSVIQCSQTFASSVKTLITPCSPGHYSSHLSLCVLSLVQTRQRRGVDNLTGPDRLYY